MDLIALTGEREEKVTVRRDGHQYLVVVGESTYRVDAVTVHGEREQRVLSLVVDGRQHEVSVAAEAEGRYRVAAGAVDQPVELLDPLTHLAREAHGGQGRSGVETVTAYMPGRVVAVLVEEGAEVEAGQGIVVLEAMKMENEIQADGPGVVKKILVQPGQPVEGGDPLFEIE